MATKKATPEKAIDFPKTLGICADRMYTFQQARLELERQIKDIKENERQYGEHLLGLMNQQKLESVKGKVGAISRVEAEVPTVNDWKKFYAWIAKTMAFDCLQKRPGVGAIQDRWADKVRIPGVVKTKLVKLSTPRKAA